MHLLSALGFAVLETVISAIQSWFFNHVILCYFVSSLLPKVRPLNLCFTMLLHQKDLLVQPHTNPFRERFELTTFCNMVLLCPFNKHAQSLVVLDLIFFFFFGMYHCPAKPKNVSFTLPIFYPLCSGLILNSKATTCRHSLTFKTYEIRL